MIGGALTWFTFTLSVAEWDQQQYVAAALAVHFAVALSAVWNRSRRGYWAFNKTLFLKVLSGILFTGVLIAELLIAISSVGELFDLKIDGWIYGWVTVFFIGFFNTLLVLSDIPITPRTHIVNNNNNDQSTEPYPKGLGNFALFVLLPLVLVFLCILYAYTIRVLFFANFNGSVAAFIIVLAIVCTIVILLVYPLRTVAEHKWTSFYSSWFGRIMIPLCVLLWDAIMVRINEYGITESRYVVIVLACCMTLISVFLALVRDPDLRVIPLILGIACLFGFVGPFSMTTVSYASQTKRLTSILSSYGVLVKR